MLEVSSGTMHKFCLTAAMWLVTWRSRATLNSPQHRRNSLPDVDPQSLQSKPPEQASTTEPASGNAPPFTPRAPKNIIVCCDGTGNEFAAKDSLDGNSNVVKLYTALRLDVNQVAYYHPGVGTLGDPTRKGIAREWSVIKGLAFGYGFRDNVLDAYRYLMQHYAAGDKVFLFGFSRGSYTARALAGLLHGYGLLCRGNEGHIPYAWRAYTETVASQKEINAHSIVTDTTFRDTFSHRDFSIHFIGSWDTVSSVGWISTPLRLLDLAQNATIQRARHAVSIDERRCFYLDNLWGPPVDVDIPVVLRGKPDGDAIPKHQDIQQVWFSGVHSDVGGSYPQLQSGLANITLEWMIGEARKAGAIFDDERVRMVLGTPAPGEPTPLTAALAPLYEKPRTATLHPSLHGIWWLLEFFPHRFYDKDDAAVKMRIPLGAYRKIPNGSLIHPTVRDRFRNHPCYKPKNITSPELVDPSPTSPTDAAGNPYLTFHPAGCRDLNLRKNWFLVFLVTILQIGVAIYVSLFVLSRLTREAYRHLHPASVVPTIRHAWIHLEQSVMGQWFRTLGPLADLLWAIIIAFVLVSIARLISLATKARS